MKKQLLNSFLAQCKRLWRGSLYQNSLFIALTSLTTSASGFIFWLIAARVFPKEDIGLATALISSMGLIIILSRFGLDNSIIKFFPSYDRGTVFSSSTIITTVISIILGILFICGIEYFSPELTSVQGNIWIATIYLLFLAADSISFMCGYALIAVRSGKARFFQSIILSSKIFFLFPLAALGFFGVFCSVGISIALASIVALYILHKQNVELMPTLNISFLKTAFSFSTGNYFVGLLMTAPSQLLPILVLNQLGPEQTAYYYIAFTLANSLSIIPNAVSTSLFVEGSHGENLRSNTIKSAIAILILLIPAIIVMFLYGAFILGFFGKDYSAAASLLSVLSLSYLFVSIVLVYFSILRIKNNIKCLSLLGGVLFVLLISSSYFFMGAYGLMGIGYAWIMTYIIGTVIIIFTQSKQIKIIFRKLEGWVFTAKS